MKRLIVLTLMLCVFTLTTQAQKKKKTKKTEEPSSEVAPVSDMVIFEEPVQEIVVEVEQAPAPLLKNLQNENGPFYIYETNSTKDVAIVYQGTGYNDRRYALFKTSTQTLLTPFIFDNITSHFGQFPYATVSINGKYGTINNEGKIVVPCIYERFSNFFIDEQLYFIVALNGLYGSINEFNEVLIPFEYTNLSNIYRMNPFMLAKKGQHYGVIDPISKRNIISFEYDEIVIYSANLLRVKKDNQYNFIDASGKAILSKWYSSLNVQDDNTVIARIDGRNGIIDLTEKIVVPFEYERIDKAYLEGSSAYLVQKNGKFGLIGKDGAVLIPVIYDNLRTFSYNSMLLVSQDNRKGLISKEGKVLLPVQYEEIELIERNILIKKDGKWGMLDKELKSVLELQYEEIQHMSVEGGSGANYIVTRNSKRGVADATGKLIVPVSYDNFVPHANTYRGVYKFPLVCIKAGKYGIVDQAGKVIVPFNFDQLIPLNSFLLIASKNNKFGVIEIYNPSSVILPMEYAFITYKQGNNLIAYKDAFVRFRVSGNKVTPLN